MPAFHQPRTMPQASETPQAICRGVSRRLAPSWDPQQPTGPRLQNTPHNPGRQEDRYLSGPEALFHAAAGPSWERSQK